MLYKITFLKSAEKEWRKTPPDIQKQFYKKLQERLKEPRIPKDELRGSLKGLYKIKLLKAGYRLVYRIIEDRVVIQIVAIGRRDKGDVYAIAFRRV